MCKIEKIPLIAIVGPTAVGKTNLAIKIAQKLNGEIISADSMQIYKEFNVCTSKPSPQQLNSVTHHCVGIISVREEFSVAKFVEIAQKAIFDINKRDKIPILCGGTGLYIDSVLKNISFEKDGFNENIRKKLWDYYKIFGKEKLYNHLIKIDPKSANSLHINNIKKIIRALEFYYSTGKIISEQVKNSINNKSIYKYIKIGINDENRKNLYKKIEKRVDKMVKCNIVDEVKKIYNLNPSKTASVAIGYKEFLPYLCEGCELENCINLLKKNTRHYAKRQITWFKRDETTKWFMLSEETPKYYEKLFENSLEYIKNSNIFL